MSDLAIPAVLFARRDSVYKSLPCDVWDADRDARLYLGRAPVVAHPPCRAWGRLRTFSKPRPDEKDLARFAVGVVRMNGGVLEHPAGSLLWPDMGLPLPGAGPDRWGGYSVAIWQSAFGHRAHKRTWLYFVGCHLPLLLPCRPAGRGVPVSSLPKPEREHTPVELARLLVEVASSCSVSGRQNLLSSLSPLRETGAGERLRVPNP